LYKPKSNQISISEFYTPFGKLDPINRWVKIANMIPWERYESRYAEQFNKDIGAPATDFRMALGTLLIRQRNEYSDEETIQAILENPYMQYLIACMNSHTQRRLRQVP
jgi:hypothetical protein